MKPHSTSLEKAEREAVFKTSSDGKLIEILINSHQNEKLSGEGWEQLIQGFLKRRPSDRELAGSVTQG